ncbi:MAG: hypothetical protein ACW967_10685 [Candidatus Hodarchaeales archaeon]
MDKTLNSYIFSLSAISIGLIIISILQFIYSPCWTPNQKLIFGFTGIFILLITLVNFPVGYFFKEKLTFTHLDAKIIFYGLLITGLLIGFGIVQIVLSNNTCLL